MLLELDRKQITNNFFVVILVLGLAALAYLFKPLYPALFIALVLVYFLNPLVNNVEVYSKRRWLAVLLTSLFLVLPALVFLSMLVLTFLSELEILLQDPGAQEFLGILGVNIESYIASLAERKPFFSLGELSAISISELAGSIAAYDQWFTKGFDVASGILKALGGILFQSLIGVFLAGYAVLNIERVKRFVKSIEHDKLQDFLFFVHRGLKQVIYSMFLTSIFAGVISAVIYWYFDLPFVLLLSITTGILVLIPAIGGWLVYMPLTGYILWRQGLIEGMLFLVMCAIFISTVPDVLIRPMLAKNKEVDVSLLTLGFVSGLLAFGPMGVLLGPIIVISAVGFFKVILGPPKRKDAVESETEPSKDAADQEEHAS